VKVTLTVTSFGEAAPVPLVDNTWLRINKVYFREDLEDTSFKFIELRYLFKERNLPQASKRPRMQATDYRVGLWDLQTNRFKMLNYVVHNPINSDYIVYGYKHPEYPVNIDHLFNIVLDELPDKYDTITGVILFSCIENMDWDALVLTALEDEIGKVVDDFYLRAMKKCALLRLGFHGVDMGESKDRFSVKIATKWIRGGHIKTNDPRQPREKNRGEPKSVNRFLPSTFFY
jgi:hypothetical protein